MPAQPMDKIVPLRRLVSWLIDRLLFLVAGAIVLYVIGKLGSPGPEFVSFDVYHFFAIQMPLTLLITYLMWFGVMAKFGPPGRRLTGTDVRRRRGGDAGWRRKVTRAAAKFLLHHTLIGFVIDALFILRDRAERRSIPDRIAGTVIARRRWS
ncbi:MAG: RDD family protein [Dehalococcoidia bacterium]|nr:RDD family protein [Dehalococcoidia bacterium]